MQPLQDMLIRGEPQRGLHDVRRFVGACHLYRRHIHNFTYSSATLTDLIKKITPWRWTTRDQECFQVLKKKLAPSNCLGVPRPRGEIVLITDASDVGGGGTIYQWKEFNPAALTHCDCCISGLNRDGSLKHDYPTSGGGWCHWGTGIGNETRRVPITLPMTGNSWPVSWCFRHDPDSWDLTLLSGFVTRNL